MKLFLCRCRDGHAIVGNVGVGEVIADLDDYSHKNYLDLVKFYIGDYSSLTESNMLFIWDAIKNNYITSCSNSEVFMFLSDSSCFPMESFRIQKGEVIEIDAFYQAAPVLNTYHAIARGMSRLGRYLKRTEYPVVLDDEVFIINNGHLTDETYPVSQALFRFENYGYTSANIPVLNSENASIDSDLRKFTTNLMYDVQIYNITLNSKDMLLFTEYLQRYFKIAYAIEESYVQVFGRIHYSIINIDESAPPRDLRYLYSVKNLLTD